MFFCNVFVFMLKENLLSKNFFIFSVECFYQICVNGSSYHFIICIYAYFVF